MRLRPFLQLLALGCGAAASGAQVSAPHNLLRPRIPVPMHGEAHVASASPWQMEQSGTTADLRGVHAAGGGVVWASGTSGTVLRSEDSGFEWQQCAVPPGAERLDFRAIWAWDANTALVLSIGAGSASRLYRTTDGCAHWSLVATNPEPKGFWDGIVFSDRNNGFLVGDPVDGVLFIEETTDGGAHWSRIGTGGPALQRPDAGTRGVFAASNSAMALGPEILGTPHGSVHTVMVGTSGPGGALVFNGGLECGMETAHRNPYACLKYWDFEKQQTPLAGATATQGIFSLAYLPGSDPYSATAVAVGGDYTQAASRTGTAAWWTLRGGWKSASGLPGGFRSAVSYDPAMKVWITVGPNGSDISRDGAKSWRPIEQAPSGAPSEWNALSLPWVVGPHGRIAKLDPALITGK